MHIYSPVQSAAQVEGVPLFIPGAGGIMPETDQLHPRSVARVDFAIEAADLGATPAIYFSGGKANSGSRSEAEEMFGHLIAGVKARTQLPEVHLETEAERSIQNWAFSMPMFRKTGLFEGKQQLAIVTDRFHLPRMLRIAEVVLPEWMSIIPVVDKYEVDRYERVRELVAGRITQVTLLGLPSGAGTDAVLHRERQYAQAKGVVKRVIRGRS